MPHFTTGSVMVMDTAIVCSLPEKCTFVTVVGGLGFPRKRGEQRPRRQVRQDQGRASVGVRMGMVRMSSHTFKGPVGDFPGPKDTPATVDQCQYHWALWSLLQPRATSQTYTQSLFSWNSHARGEHIRGHPACSEETEHIVRLLVWREHC